MSAASWVLEVDALVKRYPKNPVPAVDGISFSVVHGEVFGLLGPNGAGKTTTIGVLTTRITPTAGTARVAGIDVGHDPVRARRHLAVVPQRNNLDRSLSIRQNLLFHAAYHGVPKRERERRADELLEQFGLATRAKDRVDMFSGGQAQRTMIARALMHRPDVLFLDEPSTGLDPAARLFVWDRITELKETGVTVMLTTHDMEEAATLADRVGIMDHGHLLALGTPLELTRTLPGSATLEILLAIAERETGEALQLLACLDGVESLERIDRTVPDGGSRRESEEIRVRLYLTREADAMLVPVSEVVSRCGARLIDVKLGVASLEDVFISLTGRALR